MDTPETTALTSPIALTPPDHVAIIMDGNGRWAEQYGLTNREGHEAGAKAALAVIEQAAKSDVLWLTLFAFSTENWQRPKKEVDDLLHLIGTQITHSLDHMLDWGVRLRIIGDTANFPPDAKNAITNAVDVTRHQTRLHLNIALGYGGRSDIVHAMRSLAHDVTHKLITPSQITEQIINSRMMTAGIPDPDMIIRTGKRKRLSNFMAWQSHYSELYFSDCLWPDFSPQHFNNAIQHYSKKERSFGNRICKNSA